MRLFFLGGFPYFLNGSEDGRGNEGWGEMRGKVDTQERQRGRDLNGFCWEVFDIFG